MPELDLARANLNYLLREIASLEQQLKERYGEIELQKSQTSLPARNPAKLNFLPTIDYICKAFELTHIERQILLLCVGWELVCNISKYCFQAPMNYRRPHPTFALVKDLFRGFSLNLMRSDSKLLKNRLIEVLDDSNALMLNQLRVNPRILQILMGNGAIDEQLQAWFHRLWHKEKIKSWSTTYQSIFEQIVDYCNWSETSHRVISLCSVDTSIKQDFVIALASHFNAPIYWLEPFTLPQEPNELAALIEAWTLEYKLRGNILVVHCENLESSARSIIDSLERFIDLLNTPLIITSIERLSISGQAMMSWELPALDTDSQRQAWRDGLGEAANSLNGQLDNLVANFQLNQRQIESVCQTVASRFELSASAPDTIGKALWDVCRTTARPRLDELAQRISSSADWEDLILPERQKQVLQEMITQVRSRTQVYSRWGFGKKSGRGLGISALFAGTSGTGKTMAAEIIAGELELDLYRIDLSNVVSKYIGETEKNLAKLFAAADNGGVILLFDEGDSLFGKRSEIKDSRDRYANLETSYLLQRLEAYRGLAIITTNLKDSLDSAFVRRLGFIVDFPFPNAAEREQIWRRVFPPNVLDIDEKKDYRKLAQLNVSGGNIRSIALGAAFKAADAGDSKIRMPHILLATKREYQKTERTLTQAEVYGWLG